MFTLQKLGYKLKASKPDENGLCLFKIIEIKSGETVAEITERTTLEVAFTQAWKFANENLTKET
jgi:hypothetical protein